MIEREYPVKKGTKISLGKCYFCEEQVFFTIENDCDGIQFLESKKGETVFPLTCEKCKKGFLYLIRPDLKREEK